MRKLLTIALVLSIAACTSAPAKQADADSAGASIVNQTAQSWQADFRHLIARQPEGTTFNITINNQGTERSSDQSQSNQGSTTANQGASATQTPTATSTVTPTADVSVPVK